jgi:hypothetical protein
VKVSALEKIRRLPFRRIHRATELDGDYWLYPLRYDMVYKIPAPSASVGNYGVYRGLRGYHVLGRALPASN